MSSRTGRTDEPTPDGGREMKVNELIEILEDMDPDADVFVMSQQSWPYAERPIMRSSALEVGRDAA